MTDPKRCRHPVYSKSTEDRDAVRELAAKEALKVGIEPDRAFSWFVRKAIADYRKRNRK